MPQKGMSRSRGTPQPTHDRRLRIASQPAIARLLQNSPKGQRASGFGDFSAI